MIELEVFLCSFCGKNRNNQVCATASTHQDNPCRKESLECESCTVGVRICMECAKAIVDSD